MACWMSEWLGGTWKSGEYEACWKGMDEFSE